MANKGNDKIVLITGTSTGIGRATALHLDQLGYHVIGTVRKESDAQNLQDAASAKLRTLLLDVANTDSIARFQEALKQELDSKGLWGLVNNAAAAFSSPLEIVPLDRLRWLFEVNLFGLLAVTQVCLPYLRKEQGRIINISSTASVMVAPFHGPYSSTKWGLNALSNALRLELRPFGIQVSVIICGAIKTPMWETGGANAREIWAEQPEEKRELYGARYGQLGRYFQEIGQKGVPPEEAAQTIADALSRDRAKYTYYVGSDAQFYRLFNKLIPERLRDWVMLRTIGLDSQPA
jgi:NAD(P)-dependent dehydrogenase (short-subunit alcohol dehydrogenase family)